MSDDFESRFLKPITRRFESPEVEIDCFRAEIHVAQQRRRDKLRILLNSAKADYPQNILIQSKQLSRDSAANVNLSLVRSVTNCENTMFSEMLDFSMNTHVLLSSKDAVLPPEADADHSGRSVGSDYTVLPNSSQAVSCNFIPSAKISFSQDPCFWKGVGSQHGSDWIVNYVNVSGGNTCSQSPSFDGEVLPGNVKEANLSVSSLYSKNGSSMYQDVHSSLTNHASEISTTHKHYGEMNFASSPFYQNTLQEVVTPSTVGSQGFDLASLAQQNVRPTNHSTWIGGGNEPDVHQATYGVEANASRLNDANIASMHNKPLDGSHNWNSELAFSTSRCGRGLEAVGGECTARGLSLSLSYHHPSELDMSRFGERIGSQNLRSAGICNVSEDSKSSYSSYVCSNAEVPTIYKSYGHSIQGIVGSSTYPRRSMGPLGPFTGYATILKNSKYLKPAQQLLDELCGSSGSRQVQTCEMSRRGFREVSISSDPMNVETEINGGIGGSSGVSSSFNSSSETGGEGQVGPGSRQPYQPEFHQKKAKLLYMQEEVCRRYKQYHQQMQMVISSFESVAGLSTATPYTSLALKTVSKHFRCLKSAISDQLRRISMVLGEELLYHGGATHSFEGDMTMPKLKFIDQSLQKQKSDGNRLSFLEPQQHVWRPQRGLPERAVAVLRAWLFDHFLHPYPTDTDKHMLASQTGLSRNQVSNWFINARVRVWKPMVEEMHMLETKGSSEMGLGTSNSNPRSNPSCGNGRRSNLPKKSPECPAVEPIQSAGAGRNSELWPQEDQSRMDCHVPSDVSVGLMGMVPYHQSGLGAVSLTLGLRHNTDGADHQQQQHQQEHHLRRHYGAHLFQEFVG